MRFADSHNPFFELVARPGGLVAHFGPVVIYRAERAAQEGSDLCAVGDAQTQQRVDAQLLVEQVARTELDALVGQQQCVELRHEGRIEVQEDGVEICVEFVEFALHHRGRAQALEEFVQLPALGQLVEGLPVAVHLVDVERTEVEETGDVLLLEAVRVGEQGILVVELVVELSQPGIGL